jgi:PAS domain S-box-containing protein
MIEKLIAVASGDFTVRAERTGRGDALDTFGFLLNNVAIEVRDLVSDHDRQRVLLETVLESMLDGVLVLDTEGKIRRTNEAMAKLLGRPTTELDGLTIGDVLAPNESGLAEKLSSDLALGPFDSRDTHFRTSTGDTLAVAVSGSPHRDFSGRPMGFVLVARDDRELRRVNAQLHLSDRLATMGTLAAGVAHEINNPLAFVSANVDYVLEEMEAVSRGDTLSAARIEDMIRALKSSRSGALRVRNIVRDLHQFAPRRMARPASSSTRCSTRRSASYRTRSATTRASSSATASRRRCSRTRAGWCRSS